MASNYNHTICDPCAIQKKTSDGTSWCSDCQETLCKECSDHHASLKATRNHNLVKLEDARDLPSDISKFQNCARHPDINIEYFCSPHDKVFCHACLADEHRSCDGVIALEVACREIDRSMLTESEIQFETINEALDKLDEEIRGDALSFKERCAQIKNKIASTKSKFLEKLEKMENALLSELDQKHLDKENTTSIINTEIQNKKGNVKENIRQIQFFKDHGTNKQIFIFSHYLKEQVKETERNMEKIMSQAQISSIAFKGNSDPIQSLGSIQTTTAPCTTKYVPPKQKSAQAIVPQTNRPLSQFVYASSFKTTEKPNVLGMMCTDDGKLLLCCYDGSNSILVYSEDGRPLQTVVMGHELFDITEIPGAGQYVVSLPDIRSIQYLDKRNLKPGNIIKLETNWNIYGIAATEKHIYAGEMHQIFMLDTNGVKIKTVDLNKTFYITYINIKDNTIITAALSYGKLISIDEKSQIEIHRYDVPNEGCFRSIVTDRQGYVYTAGQDTGVIYRLTPELKQDMTITNENFKDISGICFNRDFTKLFVCNNRGKNIIAMKCS